MKKAVQVKRVPIVEPNTPVVIRILKVASCPNLSGKSNLTYHVGCTAEQAIAIRVYSNDGGGYFSPEWVLFTSIQEALEKCHKPLTSYGLRDLFNGKSANSPGFLFAALYAEGLAERNTDNPRVYVATDPASFIAEITQLMATDLSIKVDHIPPGRKTAPPSKKAKPSKSNQQNSDASLP